MVSNFLYSAGYAVLTPTPEVPTQDGMILYNAPMYRAQALQILTSHQEEILNNYAVRHLGLFGSTARDDARADSDVDVLVEFNGPATFGGYIKLKAYLEQLLGGVVDLVTESGLKPRARLAVEKDLIRVA